MSDQTELRELARLVDDIGRLSFEARVGRRGLPDEFDAALWGHLDEAGLTRLTSSGDAGPAELAVVLSGLARHAAAVPVAETDLLAAWLAASGAVEVPDGPLTVALGDARWVDDRLVGRAAEVPWPRAGAVVLAARTESALCVAVLDDPVVADSHSLAGEPRGMLTFDLPADTVARLDPDVGPELIRRGAWARCVQIVGTLDAASQLAVAHTRDRVQFGRPLAKFQAVQHALAAQAGELERARSSTELAVAAAADFGFGSAAADYAVTVAKVAVGRSVEPVTTIAHQLHGAIGTTIEHPLWLATMRARSWVDDYGSTGQHARRLGRLALAAENPWDVVVSCPTHATR